MGILKRRRRSTPATQDPRRELAFSAELPVGEAAPLWRLQVQLSSVPQADGERLRLRAHLETNFASALRRALEREPGEQPALRHDGHGSSALRLRERTGHAVQSLTRFALRAPLLRRVAEPLLQLDLNTWLEVQTSTASLLAGSRELLPQAERLAALGIHPRASGDQPVAETWSGDAPDGFAQVSVLQLDRRHLPPKLQQLLGEQPFGLAATIVSTAQQKPRPRK